MNSNGKFALACPISISQYPSVMMAHGGGGKLMHRLIEKMFMTAFANPLLETRHDGALLAVEKGKLAFTTDSYVVHPLFFPGGDIGKLAVCGTVNDLAMCGARPLYLSLGMILEEGLPMETLWAVVQSIQQTAQAAGVQIVTGDTKVVDHGRGDGVYLNTAGIGVIEADRVIAPGRIECGDQILINGDVGRHGIAIMASREGLSFETTIESDCAPLAGLVMELLDAGIEIHCLRDLTRGGLASALIELSEASGTHFRIIERAIPVNDEVRGACEILGLDPLYVANEGRFAAIVKAAHVERAMAILRAHSLGKNAALIGCVEDDQTGVSLTSAIGTQRVLDMLSGEQLPRIC